MEFIKITPKNKKLLKSSTVRRYLRSVEAEIEKQFMLNPELFLGVIPMTATEVRMRMKRQDPFKDFFKPTNTQEEVMEETKNEAETVAPTAPVESINLALATSITYEQLSDVMNYHPWTEDQIEKGDKVRTALGEALRVIVNNVPPSPDRSTAIRKLRDARMDCNSAITHSGKF